jgi:hypothetical protein
MQVLSHPKRRRRLVSEVVLAGAFALAAIAATTSPAVASTSSTSASGKPVQLAVASPRNGELAGRAGAGFVVDLSLTARNRSANTLLAPESGYKPFFNNPTAPTFHAGPNAGAPGLVVMLSTTPDTPGTPFRGPRTNLAGLFQINGVSAKRGLIQIRDTWQIGKAGFGSGPSTLTAFAVPGTAPDVVPDSMVAISNTVTVHFNITAPVMDAAATPAN